MPLTRKIAANDLSDVRPETTADDRLWMESYRKLAAFQKANSHCNVAETFENTQLFNWVKAQRSSQKRGTMRKDREQLLNDLGFIWRNGRHTQENATLDETVQPTHCIQKEKRAHPGPSERAQSAV